MVKALIFDCFGVLVGSSYDYLKSLAPTSQAVEDLNDLIYQAERGYISKAEYETLICELLNISNSQLNEISKSYHVKLTKTVDLLSEKRHEGLKIALLSNVAKYTLESIFTDFELGSMFDDMVISSETNLVKPDPLVYELVANRLDLKPEECVMIDDLETNVRGAAAIGMKGIVYKNIDQLKSDLDKIKE